MASQCHSLYVHSSTSSRLLISNYFSTPSSTSGNLRASVFFRGQRLQPQRLSQISLSPISRPLVQCVSSTFGSSSNNGDERQQSTVISNVVDKATEPIRAFPWAKASSLFLRRLLDQLWTVGKWLAIPMLAVSVLGELAYTLLLERVLVIPVGMICGIVFAGIMRETALELSPRIEEEQTPRHLIALGLLFVALKFIAPYLPTWGRVSVPHFANGGLWQVITLVNDWRKKHADRKTVEQS